MRYLLFITLGSFFRWAAKHPSIAKMVPKFFFRWSLGIIPRDIKSDPQVRTACLAGMQQYLEHFLDEHPERLEDTVDEIMEQIATHPNWQATKEQLELTDSDAREVISNAFFLVKHRVKYKREEK